MDSAHNPPFGRLRGFFWPIYRVEIKKFVPLFLIYALICFNYSILKVAKDALVITAPGGGAEALPFIKMWAILPMALLITALFTRLFNRYSQEKLFYIMIGSFLIFFLLFVFFLYPFRDVLHPHLLADQLQEHLPRGFRGLISIFRNWSFTLFYVMAELWSTAIMSVLFWGFANEITTVKDAKRFYGIISVGANLAAIFSGQIAILISARQFVNLPFLFKGDPWGQCLATVTFVVVFVGLLTMAIFRWYHVAVLNKDPALKQLQSRNQDKRRSVKMGLRKSFAYLIKSKYLLCIAILVVAFNLSINMIEIIWKDQIRQLYPDPVHFNAYMGKVLRSIGIVSTFVGLFITGSVIRKLGWTFSALVTPIALLATGVIFFIFLLFQNHPLVVGWTSWMGLTPLMIIVFLGSMQNVFSRASKYTLFDATKEIAFIPLDTESKLKGKAAIDGVGSRLGKSGGSLIYQVLLMTFGSLTFSAPYVGVFLLVMVGGWIVAAKALGKRFNAISSEEKPFEAEEKLSPSIMKEGVKTGASI
ncbi:MAG: NTP/NDP exchange transporter [Simkania negevensis]|nr:NTP/NDP exchange transporter [Simkania negevensis]